MPCGRSRLTCRRSRPSALTRGFPLRASCHPRRTAEPSGDNSGTERCMRSESLAVPPECGDAPGPRAARTLSAPSTSSPSTAQPPRVPARDHGDRHGPCSSPRDGSAPSPFSQSVLESLPFSRRLSLVSYRAYLVGASSVAGARCVCRGPGFARPLKLCPARIGPGRLRSSAPGKTGLRTCLPSLSPLSRCFGHRIARGGRPNVVYGGMQRPRRPHESAAGHEAIFPSLLPSRFSYFFSVFIQL